MSVNRDSFILKRSHLLLKAKLADEVVKGKYPDFKKDLVYFKAMQEKRNILSNDEITNQTLSKIEALKIIKNMDYFDWTTCIAFSDLPSTYDEVLT